MEALDMVFIGFGRHVVALDRTTGNKLWDWKAPKMTSYPAVLLDGDRLIVSVMGYTYCLDPWTGRQIWENDLEGLGIGVACIATARGHTDSLRAAAAEEASRQSSAATSA